VDEALFAAYGRLSMMLSNLPSVRVKLPAAGAELHIIARDQVTTDLPEWRQDKSNALAEYNGLTRDQRTRGMGGLMTSCGEENLLKLEKDRYRGRDICVHEFSHNILGHGVSREVRQKVREQYRRSLDHGLWVGSYDAVLGSMDFEAKNFYYDNPLVGGRPRYLWHVCPCCVGNTPRTLLMIPTWTYGKGKDGLYVNLFLGSTINVEKVAGTDVEMVQKTDYVCCAGGR
jgi:hypothetical protein